MEQSNVYLLVHHDRINPAHWQLFLTNPNTETVGTLVEIVSSEEGGYERKTTHDYNRTSIKLAHSTVYLGSVDSSLALKIEQSALGIDPNGFGCNVAPEEV